MTYTEHVFGIIKALLAADPKLSAARLSGLAGLGNNWVSTFLARKAGTLGRADDVVAAARRLCPAGTEGDEVRRLLAMLDAQDLPAADQEEDAA